MEQPPGFGAEGETTKVCKLQKAIYGLKQSPRSWFDKFSTLLLEFGYKWCVSDYSAFVKHSDKRCIISVVYVDDIVILDNDSIGIQDTKEWLKSRQHFKDLGPLHYLIGIEVLRNY